MLSTIELILAQNLLKNKECKKSKQYLQKNLQLFKQQEEYDNVILCRLLLAQCQLYESKSQSSFNTEFRQIVEAASIYGITLKGVYISEALWRAGQYLWNCQKKGKGQLQAKKKVKQDILNEIYTIAIEGFSNYLNRRLLGKKISCFLKKSRQFTLRPLNLNAMQVQFSNQQIQGSDFKYLANACWPNLNSLYLYNNKINKEGSQYLANGKWQNLSVLDLQENQISDEGCLQLAKGDWPNLSSLNLRDNNISAKGCEHLIKGNWLSLCNLNLKDNKIGSEGCEYLSKGNWPNLSDLDLYNNNVGKEGCRHLTKGNWPNLSDLDLWENNIGNEGCKFISKGIWLKLRYLSLQDNNIDNKGCEYLAKGVWPNLSYLNLEKNKIDSQHKLMLEQSFPGASIIIEI